MNLDEIVQITRLAEWVAKFHLIMQVIMSAKKREKKVESGNLNADGKDAYRDAIQTCM